MLRLLNGWLRQGDRRILIIKRLGAGFWADIDHVVAQVAAAEAMGREAIVDWGTEGPYGNGKDETFSTFFEPLSDVRLERPKGDIWPPSWTRRNLAAQLPFPATGKINETYGVYFLCEEKGGVPFEDRSFKAMESRNEPVLVSYCWEHPGDIAILVSKESRFHGLSPDEMRKIVMSERIRLKPGLAAAVDEFCARNGVDRERTMAVHLRGSDKVTENAKLHDQNEHAIAMATDWVAAGNKVFVMTDSEQYLERCRSLLGEAMIVQDCIRTSSDKVANYMLDAGDGFTKGREIIIDTYVAARCGKFIGNYSSNVAKYVAALGDFGAGDITFTDR